MLLPRFGVQGLPAVGVYWPAALILAGVIPLWTYFSKGGGPEELFTGIVLSGTGTVVLLYTLGSYGLDMADVLPALAFVAGVAFLARYGTDRTSGAPLLAFGLVLAVLGGAHLLTRTGFLAPSVLGLWPVLLILSGIPLAMLRK